jgi:hypothetical protein
MPKGIFERTEKHREQARINGSKQKGKPPANTKFVVGGTYNTYTIVESLSKIGDSKRKWKCICINCGAEVIRNSHQLTCGYRARCLCKIFTGSNNFTGYKDIPGKYWKRILRGANLRNIPVEVTIEDIWEVYSQQNKKCALSNLDISFGRENNLEKYTENCTASLDRIDNTKGYIKNNIQWVHKDINMIKKHYEQDYFLYLCKLIVNNIYDI